MKPTLHHKTPKKKVIVVIKQKTKHYLIQKEEKKTETYYKLTGKTPLTTKHMNQGRVFSVNL